MGTVEIKVNMGISSLIRGDANYFPSIPYTSANTVLTTAACNIS